MMTCLNGYFHDAALDSLGERLIKAERVGAVAVCASSGMTMPTDQALINQELYRLLLMSQYYVFTIQRPSNKNDAARPGGSSHARPGEKGFVAFERRDRPTPSAQKGCATKENVGSIICTTNRAMLNILAPRRSSTMRIWRLG